MDPNLKSILSRVDHTLTKMAEEQKKTKQPITCVDADLIENLRVAAKEVWMLRSVGYDDFVGQCKNCHEYEEHTPTCVVRVIDEWLAEIS